MSFFFLTNPFFPVEPLGHGSVLGPANMRTFRADGVMLSSVQNYKVILSFTNIFFEI